MLNWALLFVPIAISLEHLAPEPYLLIFVASGLANPPLASWMVMDRAFFFVPATLPR